MGLFSKKNDSAKWDNDAVLDFYESGEIEALTDYQYDNSSFDGEKYPGGMGQINDLFDLDYWGLRQRSNELFRKNGYAAGIIKRFITNVIHTRLKLELNPEEEIIGLEKDSLLDWSEETETRYFIYNETPTLIDGKKCRNGGALMRQVYLESAIGGDCLVYLRQHKKAKLPVVHIVQGDRVQTPFDKWSDASIVDGVKVDKNGKQEGYYVLDDNSETGYTYIPAYGPSSKRLQAKLIYGFEKREDDVRGVPLLAVAMQPLSEIDKYRDSTQRKATLNSIMVAAIERDANFKGPKTKPISRGAVKKTAVEVLDQNGQPTRINYSDMMPGLNFERMQPGEKVSFFQNNGVDLNFGAFEAAILTGLAWFLEVPPEILFLSFNKNYSASQAATNEWKMFLEKDRERFGSEYCDFIFQDWFLSMVLLNKIKAPGYLEDRLNPLRWDVVRAWTIADWTGQVKPSTDMLKSTKAYALQCESGFTTREKSTRDLNGGKYRKNVSKLQKENQMLADAMRPILELETEFGKDTTNAIKSLIDNEASVLETIDLDDLREAMNT